MSEVVDLAFLAFTEAPTYGSSNVQSQFPIWEQGMFWKRLVEHNFPKIFWGFISGRKHFGTHAFLRRKHHSSNILNNIGVNFSIHMKNGEKNPFQQENSKSRQEPLPSQTSRPRLDHLDVKSPCPASMVLLFNQAMLQDEEQLSGTSGLLSLTLLFCLKFSLRRPPDAQSVKIYPVSHLPRLPSSAEFGMCLRNRGLWS